MKLPPINLKFNMTNSLKYFIILFLLFSIVILLFAKKLKYNEQDWPNIFVWSEDCTYKIGPRGHVSAIKNVSSIPLSPVENIVIGIKSNGQGQPHLFVSQVSRPLIEIQLLSPIRDMSLGNDSFVLLQSEADIADLKSGRIESKAFIYAATHGDSFVEAELSKLGKIAIKLYRNGTLLKTIMTNCTNMYEITGLDVLNDSVAFSTISALNVITNRASWSKNAPKHGSFSGVKFVDVNHVVLFAKSNSPLFGSWSRLELHSRSHQTFSDNVNGSVIIVSNT